MLLIACFFVVATPASASKSNTDTYYVYKGSTTNIDIPKGHTAEIYYYPGKKGITHFLINQDSKHIVLSNQATVSFAWAKNKNSEYKEWTTLKYANYLYVKLDSGDKNICYKMTIKPISWNGVYGAHATIV
jgi:hypothetical protein